MFKPAKVSLYAVNAKGSSEPYAIEVVLKGVAKFTGKCNRSSDKITHSEYSAAKNRDATILEHLGMKSENSRSWNKI